MATRHRDKSATPLLMVHMSLGVDQFGQHHHFDARTDTVHVVDPDDGRVHVEDVSDRDVDEWMTFVGERRGWARRDYGVGLDTMLARGLEGH